MAQPLTLEMANATIGCRVLKRDRRAGGRPWLPVQLVGIHDEETAVIRPPGHKKNELEKITNLKLCGKQIGRFAHIAAPYLRLKDPTDKPPKQAPKFNGKPKQEKPVISLTQEEVAAVASSPMLRVGDPPLEVGGVAEAKVPEILPSSNPREAWRQKQIAAAQERFVIVDRETKRFYTEKHQWKQELALARHYKETSANRASGRLMGKSGKSKGSVIEVMTLRAAGDWLNERLGVLPLPKGPVTEDSKLFEEAPTVVTTGNDELRQRFDSWARHLRDAAVADELRLVAMGATAISEAELTIMLRKRELGL